MWNESSLFIWMHYLLCDAHCPLQATWPTRASYTASRDPLVLAERGDHYFEHDKHETMSEPDQTMECNNEMKDEMDE